MYLPRGFLVTSHGPLKRVLRLLRRLLSRTMTCAPIGMSIRAYAALKDGFVASCAERAKEAVVVLTPKWPRW